MVAGSFLGKNRNAWVYSRSREMKNRQDDWFFKPVSILVRMKTDPGSGLYGGPWRIFSSSSSCQRRIKVTAAAPRLRRPPSAVMKSHDFMGGNEIYGRAHCKIHSGGFASYSSCEFGRTGCCLGDDANKTMTVTWQEFGWRNPCCLFIIGWIWKTENVLSTVHCGPPTGYPVWFGRILIICVNKKRSECKYPG